MLYLVGWTMFLVARIVGRPVPRRVWGALLVVALVPALSLLFSTAEADEGVVVESAEARLGPGYGYGKAYEGILHEACEFRWLGSEKGWVLARMPDGNEVWLRETSCMRVE